MEPRALTCVVSITTPRASNTQFLLGPPEPRYLVLLVWVGVNCLGLLFWVLHMKRWIFQLMDTQVLLISPHDP